jgi:uncharacterized repeat protein (TIGR01451 family)
MDLIDKESSFSTLNEETIYSSLGNFSGGIAQIGYIKYEPNSKKTAAYISETYHGSFRIDQHLDSYSKSPTYNKYATGSGFVSSDKRVACNQRSYEYGSGSYESAEALQADVFHKNSSLVYQPNVQSAGTLKIGYTDKWNEGMYTVDPGEGSMISNKISSADSIQKEALMGSSFLSMTGRFNGTNLLEVKKFNGTLSEVKKGQGSSEAIEVEQLFIGSYAMDTTIAISKSLKYVSPHINITKIVLSLDSNTIIYRINVTNDGNKTFAPVVIVDLLPEGATFISSTLKPDVKGRVVSWSLLALPVGEVQTIDLKAKLDDVSPEVINRVKVFAVYQNRTLTAGAESSPYKTIESQEEKNESIETYTTGEWKPPSCMGLNLNITDCEKEIDEYYDNLDECRYDCP